MQKMLDVAIEAARLAGEILEKSRPQNISEKSKNDYVTEIDFECQEAIVSHIKKHYPDHIIMAEENNILIDFVDNMWIIDPLDGTTNFIHDLRHSSISIAFYDQDEVQLGLIYNPYSDELFTAIKGKGAFLNGKQINCSSLNLKNGLISTGFPFKKLECLIYYKDCFADVLLECKGIRRFGSAALDLAWTACGRYDGFFEGWLSPWDVASGMLIASEAGLVVSDFNKTGNVMSSGCIVAANPACYDRLYEIVNQHLGKVQNV